MPPGRKAKPLPAYITVAEGEDSQWLRCTVCPQVLKRDSLAGHLKSTGHKKSEANHELTLRQRKEREQEQLNSLAAKEANNFAMLTSSSAARTSNNLHPPGAVLGCPRFGGNSAQESALWSSLDAGEADIEMTIESSSSSAHAIDPRGHLEDRISTFGLWDPTRSASQLGFHFGNETTCRVDDKAPTGSDAELLTELLQNIDLDHAHRLSGNTGYGAQSGQPLDEDMEEPCNPSSDTYPYPNYPTFLVDILDNGLTRLPVPESLMKMFLYILRECGVPGVPTLYGLRKLQERLRKTCGVPTIPCQSPQGNVFWMVDPRTLIAKDWANPEIRENIHVYPEIPDGPISEVWHTNRWHKGLDKSTLSPMYDDGNKHYYIDEVCLLQNGNFVVPQRWVVFRGTLHAEVHWLKANSEDNIHVDDSHADLVPVKSLYKNLFDLQAEGSVPEIPYGTTPNPLRELADGDPLYSSYVNHFADDVSGNRSKSWNKHYNAYITHANLPRRFLSQEAHIHFVSTSPHATATEQFRDFKRVVESTHTQPVKVFDPLTRQHTRFRMFVNAEPSDNPMQSEISGHIGGNGNMLCRKCKAGGTTVEKESDAGFHSLFFPGEPRDKGFILNELRAQIACACLGIEKHVKDRQTQSGVKDTYTQFWIDDLINRARALKKDNPRRPIGDIQRELLTWVDENKDRIYSPFLTLHGLDPTLDTPIELLHTVLLGVVKYAWHGTHTSWTPAQKSTYALRLQATNTDALSVHAIRANYILQYANSLIGRQLKTIVQTAAFHTHGLLDSPKFSLWLAIGEMTALLWFPEIQDMKTYKADLTTAIANVLDIFAEIDPSKIVEKVKLHVLSHAPDDAERFGPLLAVITEAFESFNSVFRGASIGSNHLAPSRDIANELADQEALKHRLMGGFWPSDDSSTDNMTWVQAGPRVRDYLRDHPGMQGIVGWTPSVPSRPGSYKTFPVPRGAKACPLVCLREGAAASALNAASYDLDLRTWTRCRSIISQAQDVCVAGSWICAQSPLAPEVTIIGRIEEAYAALDAGNALVIVDVFEIAAVRHLLLGMPYLIRRHGEKSSLIIGSQDIRFAVNVQHDCEHAGCAATGQRNTKQERVDSGNIEQYIEHTIDTSGSRYIINTHSLHNPHLIRNALPRNLVAPVPRYSEERQSEHHKMAARLRETRNGKRAEQSARKAEKKAKAQEDQGALSEAQNQVEAASDSAEAASHGDGLGTSDGSDTSTLTATLDAPGESHPLPPPPLPPPLPLVAPARPRPRPRKRQRVEQVDDIATEDI